MVGTRLNSWYTIAIPLALAPCTSCYLEDFISNIPQAELDRKEGLKSFGSGRQEFSNLFRRQVFTLVKQTS